MDKDIIMKNLLKRETDRQFEIEKKRNEMKLIHPEHEQYHYFTKVFHDKLKEIHVMLEASNSMEKKDLISNFETIWKELHTLQKFVADSLLFLRDYDIRICQKNLQDTELKTRKLEENLLPKKKFGFKNKRTPEQNYKIQLITSNDETDTKNKQHLSHHINDNFYGFKNETNNTTLSMHNESLLKKDISLEFLDKCLVRLNGSPSTLHMNNLSNCVILCGPVATSVFIENCTNCKFAIACQQLRLHTSKNCDIYLHVTSKAIIEDSSQIYVTEYNYDYDHLSADFEKSTLDQTINNWSDIDDFNWLVLDKQSPNWNILDNANKIHNWNNFQLN